MFVVLRTVKPANGFFKKKRQKKNFELCEPVSFSTENGLPFFILDVLEDKSGINWSLTEEKCGRYVSRIVAPRSITLPDNRRLKRFVPGISNGIFIFNTALDIIKKAKIAPEAVSITVIDRNASINAEIHRLLPFASAVRVVTSRPDRYSPVCERIYNEFGASIVIRPAYEPCDKKDIVICCDGATSQSMQNAAVFSFRRGIYGKIRFYCSGTELSEKHREIIPDSIDSADFASALTELCGSTEYKSSTFSQTKINCNVCGDASAEKCLCCYIYGKGQNQ
ncbi:MAG: hypothetical protein IJE74_01150 [Clostridia bacterium]|nr:hypothetical protein [Clostridia bacterium]